MIFAAALAAQVALSPCTIEGAGEARCDTYTVWEDRDARRGRRIDLSIILFPALEPGKLPDPLFMLSGGPGDAPSFNARFFSRVFHTLLLSGELDPVTPPSGGDEVARHLRNARPVVIRNNGHPIGTAEACIAAMIGEFLDRASVDRLDTSCAAAVPAIPFVVPGPKK